MPLGAGDIEICHVKVAVRAERDSFRVRDTRWQLGEGVGGAADPRPGSSRQESQDQDGQYHRAHEPRHDSSSSNCECWASISGGIAVPGSGPARLRRQLLAAAEDRRKEVLRQGLLASLSLFSENVIPPGVSVTTRKGED